MLNLRHTKSRQAVLRAVKLSSQAISAEQVTTQVKAWWPAANLATVYRNLVFLTKRGEIYQVDTNDGLKKYIGHSFHQSTFHCQRCGQTHDLSLESARTKIKLPRRLPGLVFFSRLTVGGLCQNCLKLLRQQGVRP